MQSSSRSKHEIEAAHSFFYVVLLKPNSGLSLEIFLPTSSILATGWPAVCRNWVTILTFFVISTSPFPLLGASLFLLRLYLQSVNALRSVGLQSTPDVKTVRSDVPFVSSCIVLR